MRGLLKSAKVGDSVEEGFKSSTISFSYRPYQEDVRMSIGWPVLARVTSPARLATSIVGALRDRLACIDWERRKAREHCRPTRAAVEVRAGNTNRGLRSLRRVRRTMRERRRR